MKKNLKYTYTHCLWTVFNYWSNPYKCDRVMYKEQKCTLVHNKYLFVLLSFAVSDSIQNTALLSTFRPSVCPSVTGVTSHFFLLIWWFRPQISSIFWMHIIWANYPDLLDHLAPWLAQHSIHPDKSPRSYWPPGSPGPPEPTRPPGPPGPPGPTGPPGPPGPMKTPTNETI